MSDSVDSGVARGFLRFAQVVGLLLLLAAFYRVFPVAKYLWDAGRMRAWEEVPATVLEADYRKQDEEDVRPRVLARYRYAYNGVDYQGNRVDIAESSELFGGFQKQMAEELQQHLDDRTPTTAYVNPSQPDESVLYPQFIYTAFSVRLLILFVFAFFGGLLFWLMTRALRRQKQQVIEERSHPQEPWLWRRDWASKRIRTSSYKYAWLVVLFAALYLFLALPLSLLVLRERGRDILSVPGVILMLVGLALFNAARLQLKVGKTFKGAEFRMSSVPGLIGGSLAGAVVVAQKVPDDVRFRVVLECAEYQHSRKGRTLAQSVGQKRSKHVDTSEHVIWRENVTVEKTLSVADLDGAAIPVYFAIPFDCKPSGLTEYAGIRWRLKAGIEEPNFHRYATFDVPVFKTAESSPNYAPDPTVMQPYEAAADATPAIERLCRVETLPGGGERLRFTYFDLVVLVAALVLVAICAAGVAATFYFQAHPAIAIFPGILGIAIFVGMTSMLLWGSSLEIRRDAVTIASGYAGFRKRYEVTRSDILGVEVEKEHSVNEQDHFCLLVKLKVPLDGEFEEGDSEDSSSDQIGDAAAELRDESDADGAASGANHLNGDLAEDDDDQEEPHLIDLGFRIERVTIVKRLERRQQAEAVRDWVRQRLAVQAPD